MMETIRLRHGVVILDKEFDYTKNTPFCIFEVFHFMF